MAFFWFPWTLVMMATPLPGAHADTKTVAALAGRALSGDAAAVGDLRALGQDGLDVLVRLRSELSSVPSFPSADPRARAWDGLVDKVARQQHATASGLYWYTDLEQAKARAQKEGKPILSLRLLGSLDEALSCANSRFFRALLYPDPAVKTRLHDEYVLHWESVRQAPKITIDFGGGRVLTRTVTGNSMHYVLDAKGRVVDALPGVFGPVAFAAWLDEVGGFTKKVARLDDASFVAARKLAQVGWRTSTLARWQEALKAVGLDVALDEQALAKATTEDVMARLAQLRGDALRVTPGVAVWLSQVYPGLPENPINPPKPGRPTAEEAAPLAISKMAVERPMLPWLRNIRGKVAQDEVQNDFLLHTKIAGMIADQPATDPSAFTGDIYAAVFLTPLDDPWMGLAPPDVFSAIAPEVEGATIGGR